MAAQSESIALLPGSEPARAHPETRPLAVVLPWRPVDSRGRTLIQAAPGTRLGAAKGLLIGLAVGASLWVGIGMGVWAAFLG